LHAAARRAPVRGVRTRTVPARFQRGSLLERTNTSVAAVVADAGESDTCPRQALVAAAAARCIVFGELRAMAEHRPIRIFDILLLEWHADREVLRCRHRHRRLANRTHRPHHFDRPPRRRGRAAAAPLRSDPSAGTRANDLRRNRRAFRREI
jgi:hypothetical protein